MTTVLVRLRSRRAADRLKRLLGVESLDWHFNLWEGNHFALIPSDRLEEARKIPGITKANPKREVHRCWA